MQLSVLLDQHHGLGGMGDAVHAGGGGLGLEIGVFFGERDGLGRADDGGFCAPLDQDLWPGSCTSAWASTRTSREWCGMWDGLGILVDIAGSLSV